MRVPLGSCIIFFFSSRRRHTRCLSDWSSDVCSSDLHTTGDSQTYTRGSSTTTGSGSSESLHRRPLIQPDEGGRFFGRVDEKEHPAYPGLALVIVTGANPFVVKRRNYFEDEQFINCFSPHPDHKFVPVAPKVVEAPAPEEDAKPKPKASDNRALYLIVGLIILGVVRSEEH